MKFNDLKGKKVKDKVTGFEGVVTAFCEYLDNSDSVRVEALINGEPKDEWFPSTRLEVID